MTDQEQHTSRSMETTVTGKQEGGKHRMIPATSKLHRGGRVLLGALWSLTGATSESTWCFFFLPDLTSSSLPKPEIQNVKAAREVLFRF